MQMIDVIKRLAELDANNPNIVKENSELDECGLMPEMESEAPSHPASLNITAGSGEELSGMLTAIMQLAGLKKVGDDDLGIEHDPMALVAEPIAAVGPAATAGDEMRSVLDKMNGASGDDISVAQGDVDNDGDHDMDDHESEKETDEEAVPGVDNSPASAQPKQRFDANRFANQENKPGQGNRMDGNMPRANAMENITANLLAEYQDFLKESE
jgi:hypothetical protein